MTQPPSIAPFDTEHDERAAAAIIEWLHEEHRRPALESDINQAVFFGMAEHRRLILLLETMTERGLLAWHTTLNDHTVELADLGAAWFIWEKQ